jgi:hypothetical protein
MGKGEVLERTDYHILRRVYLNMVDAMGAPMLKLACTYAKMGRKKTLTSVTTTTDSYWKKGPARTVKNTVLGCGTTTTDSYHSKEPTRRVRETVLGFLIIRMGLLTQNSQEPIRTAGR